MMKKKNMKNEKKMVQYYIPGEIVRNILSHLPGESQFRFMIVCKEWHSIINEQPVNMLCIFGPQPCAVPLSSYVPQPRYRYSLRSTTTTTYTTHAKNIKVNVNTDWKHTKFPQLPSSCNGLLLLSNDSQRNSALWGPFSREWLPLRPHRFSPYIGIGYDVKTDDYKVVELHNGHSNVLAYSSTFIYSGKSQVWRKIDDVPFVHVEHHTGVFANDALHWLATEGNQKVVISLDLSTETYRSHLPLPSCCHHSRTRNYHKLYALEGYLFLLCFEDYTCGLWILKDCENRNGKNWHKLATLREKNISGRGTGYWWYKMPLIYPVAYVKSNDQVVVRYEERFMWFDLKSNKCLKMVTVKGIGMLPCTVLSTSLGWLSENHENGLKLDIQTSLCFDSSSAGLVQLP